ncbi:MAG: hypothetical protein Q8Q26_18720 [Pseudorhodobacter sp.]|nr:hypothetical protein [Pseudorhodobacter sp.]
MRLPFVVAVAFGLAGCGGPTVPDSGAGAGFQDYSSYLNQREAALSGGAPAPIAPTAPTFSTAALGAAIDAADPAADPSRGLAAPAAVVATDPALAGGTDLAADRPRGDAPVGIAPQSGEVVAGSAAISDEQDFSAVAARETIESDAERLARNRAQYQVIEPTALPERSGDAAPNIVQYALSTSNPVGVPLYKRASLQLTNATAACARFSSPDRAQEAFLASGGPEKDRKGIDPDGDGFACSWDPTPFRAAMN